MCSIDEAWAGQQFEGSPAVSQADTRMSYMSIPNNLMNTNNQFSLIQKQDPMTRYSSRGINSQLSRTPRVPITDRMLQNDTSIQISSTMPTNMPPYSGEEPRPNYMHVYDKAGETDNIPMPASMRDNFDDFETAFNVSDTVNSFTGENNKKHNTKKTNGAKYNNNDLINENNNNDHKVISYKNALIKSQEYLELKSLLVQVIKRLDTIETKLHTGQKNTCDITLYVLIGILVAFLIYSIFIAVRK